MTNNGVLRPVLLVGGVLMIMGVEGMMGVAELETPPGGERSFQL